MIKEYYKVMSINLKTLMKWINSSKSQLIKLTYKKLENQDHTINIKK